MSDEMKRTILGVCAVALFAVIVVWLTSCVNHKVIKGVNRHEMLKEHDCYEFETLEDGSKYVSVIPTDMCMSIVYADTLVEGDGHGY